MAGTTFTQYTDSSTLARESQAVLTEQRSLFISADLKRDSIHLSMASDAGCSIMIFTAEQARAVAVELLACADARDAHDAAQSTNSGLEG